MTGSIRHARATDVAAIEALVRSAPGAIFDAGELYGHGHLLVLDLGEHRLGGVAHLDVEDERARLDLLVVDPALAPEVEERLADVARAVGEAYGCRHVDTVAVDYHVSVPWQPVFAH